MHTGEAGNLPSATLVPWHRWIHLHAPRINPTLQAPHVRTARRLQDLERLHRAHAVAALRDDLAVPVPLAVTLGQFAQCHQPRPVDTGDRPLLPRAPAD